MIQFPQETFKYSYYLRDLKIHSNTIEANAKNYRYWLENLYKISLSTDNLEIWQQFLKHTQDTLIEQIQVDLAYLDPARQLFEEMIATIRGIVEIEQAESARIRDAREKRRDFELQLVVAAIGSGLAVSGITSQVEPRLVEALCSQMSTLQLPIIKAICLKLPFTEIQTDVSTNNIISTGFDILLHVVIGLLFTVAMYFS